MDRVVFLEGQITNKWFVGYSDASHSFQWIHPQRIVIIRAESLSKFNAVQSDSLFPTKLIIGF